MHNEMYNTQSQIYPITLTNYKYATPEETDEVNINRIREKIKLYSIKEQRKQCNQIEKEEKEEIEELRATNISLRQQIAIYHQMLASQTLHLESQPVSTIVTPNSV